MLEFCLRSIKFYICNLLSSILETNHCEVRIFIYKLSNIIVATFLRSHSLATIKPLSNNLLLILSIGSILCSTLLLLIIAKIITYMSWSLVLNYT